MDSEKTKDRKLFIKEFLKTVFIIIIIMVITKLFVLEPFLVRGSSMEPTFQNNNYIFVESLSNIFKSPHRGDVVIFQHPEGTCDAYVKKHPIKNFLDRLYFVGSIPPATPCVNFIKRVIAVPGETIIIKDGVVRIKNNENPDGFILNESYIPKDESYKLRGDVSKTLGKNEYFVLGDNRQPNASLDSREWGVLPKDHITGKAWVRILPFNEFGLVSRPKY